jgi:hypothetical protein
VVIAAVGRMFRYRALFALAAVGACASDPPAGEPVVSRVERLEVPIGFVTKTDLLLVIDNSPAMAQHTAKLAGDVRRMMMAAERLPGVDGAPDLRVGVITSEIASDGGLRGGGFLAEETRFGWESVRNYQGELADAMAPLADVGAAGGEPRLFATLARAIAMPGFLRDDAYLAVILVTSSDDAGTEDVAAIAAALRATKPADPTKVVVNAATACAPAKSPRVQALLDQFPNRSKQLSLCAEDLAPLAAFEYLYKVSLGAACFERPLREPHDCAAWLVDPLSDAEATLPECAQQPGRCWSVKASQLCLDGRISVDLPYTPFGAAAVLECVTAD